MSKIVPFPSQSKAHPTPKIVLHRTELNVILAVYGSLVANGKARDYAIDMGPDRAAFSIFRHAAERATWRIEKNPALRRKQGEWCVTGMNGQVLKRGHELAQVLRIFDRYSMKIVTD